MENNQINNVNWNLWINLAFKLTCYRKNFDLVSENENFISLYTGTISKLRVIERKLPLLLGEYSLSTWNLKLGRVFNTDFQKLIYEHRIEDSYYELLKLINSKEFDINQYDKLVIIHHIILREDYRKCDITAEIIESVYRDFYDDRTAILVLVKPLQDNNIDFDFYSRLKKIEYRETYGSSNVQEISAYDYYDIKSLINKTDRELNEYKLFAAARKCGFNRISESYLFQLIPKSIQLRMKTKYYYNLSNLSKETF